MKILSLFRKPKPMEKPMNPEILSPSVNRAVQYYNKLVAAHAAAAAKILEQDATIKAYMQSNAMYKAILDENFPEDVGGSTGG